MIISTRYRDIPYEEAIKCAKPPLGGVGRDQWEKEYRGKPLKIETPAVDKHEKWACSGPFYSVAGEWSSVCPHIAEIGD